MQYLALIRKHDMFIWNILSLNSMRLFGGKPNNKIMQAWPKADDIIPLRAEYYIWYHIHCLA